MNYLEFMLDTLEAFRCPCCRKVPEDCPCHLDYTRAGPHKILCNIHNQEVSR